MTPRARLWHVAAVSRKVLESSVFRAWGRLVLQTHPAVELRGAPSLSGPCDIDIDPRGKVIVGKGVRINSGALVNAVGGFRRTVLRVYPGAHLELGDDVGISSSSIVCCTRIVIGARTLVGGDCAIYDSDFHSTRSDERQMRPDPGVRMAPVVIGEDCFIGAHSIILKGVAIGARAVVGAGSVVRHSIPEGEIWAGNPAVRVARART